MANPEQFNAYLAKVKIAQQVPGPDQRPMVNFSDSELLAIMENSRHPQQKTAFAESVNRLRLDMALKGLCIPDYYLSKL